MVCSLLLSCGAAVHPASPIVVLGRRDLTGGIGEARPLMTAVPRAAHHVLTQRAPLLNRRLQILVRLLLDGLRVLQLLDQLHLDQFHLHDLLLLVADEPLLFFDLARYVGSSLRDLPPPQLISLLLGALLVELNAALTLQVQPLDVFELLLLSSVVLLHL